MRGIYYAPPIISLLNHSAGWPGGIASDGSTVQGTLVIIHGRYFHPTPEMHRNQISFAGSSGDKHVHVDSVTDFFLFELLLWKKFNVIYFKLLTCA